MGTISTPTRVNVKGAQTSSTGANIGLGVAGTSEDNPVWWRGYSSIIGDLDTDYTTTRPTLTVQTGFRVSITGGYQKFSNLVFTGNYQFAALLRYTGTGPFTMVRVKATNVFADAAAAAIMVGPGANCQTNLVACHFEANATASGAIDHQLGYLHCHGCVLKGGVAGLAITNTGNANGAVLTNCILLGTTYGAYIQNTLTRILSFVNCTFYNPSSDAVRVTSNTDSQSVLIANCIFDTVGGYGVKNTNGTTQGMWLLDFCDTHSLTSGVSNGLVDDAGTGDGSARAMQVDASSPFVSAGTDFTPATGSNAIANAFPGALDV